MKKKLLCIDTFEAPYRINFFNGLSEKYDVTLALSQTSNDQKERNPKWFSQNRSVIRNYNIIHLNSIKIGKAHIYFNIKKIIEKNDIVFLDMYGDPMCIYSIILLKLLKKKFILSVDGMIKRDNENILLHHLKKFLLGCPEKILSPGASVDKCLHHYGVDLKKIQRYNFTPLSKAEIASAGIKHDKTKVRTLLNIEESIVVLAVGQFIHRKGFDILIKALEGINERIGVYFVGGTVSDEYIDLVSSLNIRNAKIHFIGFKEKKELSRYFMSADIFCLPTREDIWGLVINEALAYGLPVITTDRCVAGLELIKNDYNGYVVKSEHIEELRERLSFLVQNEDVRKSMSQNALSSIRDYSIESMVDTHIKVFENTFV